MAEPFELPDLKGRVGWRLLEQDEKDLQLLMALYKEKSPTALLRRLIHRDAEEARERWHAAAARHEETEDADV